MMILMLMMMVMMIFQAISNCCELETNRALFGKAGAVAPLVSYLTSSDLEVHRTTAAALHQLSKVLKNISSDHLNNICVSGSLELCDDASVRCGHPSAASHWF